MFQQRQYGLSSRFSSTELVRVSILALGLLLVGLTGCAPQLNLLALKGEIRAGLADRTGLPIRTIDCPTHRMLRRDDAFNCLVRLDRQSYLVVWVQQISDRGDIRWQVVQARGVVNLGTMQVEIAQALARKTQTSGQVNCGKHRYQIARTGDVIECKAVDEKGNQGSIVVTIRDEEGRYDWALNPNSNPSTVRHPTSQ